MVAEPRVVDDDRERCNPAQFVGGLVFRDEANSPAFVPNEYFFAVERRLDEGE